MGFAFWFSFLFLFGEKKDRKFYLCIISTYVFYSSVDYLMLSFDFHHIVHVFVALNVQFFTLLCMSLYKTEIAKIQSIVMFMICVTHFLQIIDVKTGTSIVYNNYEIIISALILLQIVGSHDRTIAAVNDTFARILSVLHRGYLHSNRLAHSKKQT